MNVRNPPIYLAALSLLSFAGAAASFGGPAPTSAQSPPFWLLATEHQNEEQPLGHSTLVQVEVQGDKLLQRALLSFEHLPGEAPRGDVSTDGQTHYVVVRREPDQATADLLAWNGQTLRTLSHTAYPGSKPLALADGSVLVTEGNPSSAASPLRLVRFRASGEAQTIHAESALALHLVAARPDRLFVYRIAADGAALLQIELSTGKQLSRIELPGYARDFSDDGARITFSNLISERDDIWGAWAWRPEQQTLEEVFRARGQSPIPFATTSPKQGWTPDAFRVSEAPGGRWYAESRGSALTLRESPHGRSWEIERAHEELEDVGFAGGTELR